MSKFPVIPRTQRTLFCEETKENITYTSFSLGMNSVLLEAGLSKDDPQILLDALKQLVESIVVGNTDITKLPYHVIEFLFVKSRCLSIGSKIPVSYLCKNQHNGEECGGTIKAEIDLDEAIIHRDPDFTDKIELGGGWFIKLRYATIENTLEAAKLASSKESNFEEIIYFYTESLYNEDEVVTKDSMSKEEWLQGLRGLGIEVTSTIIEKFYSKLPHVRVSVEAKCEKCGKEHTVHHEGINELFM